MISVSIYNAESSQDKEETGVSKLLTLSVYMDILLKKKRYTYRKGIATS